MTRLNDRQARLLASVREIRDQIQPTLDVLEFEYESAVYRAKGPVRDAINAALDEGVPYSRVTNEGMGFSYPGKLRDWLRPAESVVDRMFAQEQVVPVAAEKFEDAVDQVQTVTKDDKTNDFVVVYRGATYRVPSYGTGDSTWSSAQPSIPQGVYDMIQESYPQWVLLEDEDDEE